MIGNAPRSPITGVPGWLTNAEEETLIKYAKQITGNACLVNIGCEYGRSVIALAKAAPKLMAAGASIDDPDGGWTVRGIELHPKPELYANLKEAGEFVHVHQMDSQDIETRGHLQRKEIDYVFVDGDHSLEGVRRDIAVWTPIVKVGGYVLFHDVAQDTNKLPHYLHYEVAKAIAEWLEAAPDEFRLIEMVDTIAVYQRVNAPAQPEPDTLPVPPKPRRKAK